MRHLPRSKSGSKYHPVNPGRPISMNDMPIRPEPELKNFPEGVERIPTCIADYSIPTLDSVTQKFGADTTRMMAKMIENQTVFEKIAWAETDNSSDSLSHAQESVPPPVCHEFQAARLFLSHFGFLSFLGEVNAASGGLLGGNSNSNLHVLDAKKGGFWRDLQMLDKISPRTFDTVYLFYVKAGQATETEIIGNMSPENMSTLDASFWTMLPTLGWEVDVNEHAGWTGFFNTSWQISASEVQGDFRTGAPSKEANVYNGEKKVLYWADVAAEIAFVVPNRWNKTDTAAGGGAENNENASGTTPMNYERSFSECPEKNLNLSSTEGATVPGARKPSLGEKPRTMSLDLEKKAASLAAAAAEPVPPNRRRTGANKPNSFSQSTSKIFLVWLESFEDHLTFPMEELLGCTANGMLQDGGQVGSGTYSRSSSSSTSTTTASECSVIFLQALGSGLLRVKLQGPIVGRMNNATPLVDGMVVNKRVIGSLVRQTAYNMAKRRRLDNDAHQPPHIKRRLKVQEMVNKYKMDLTEPELLAHLFNAS